MRRPSAGSTEPVAGGFIERFSRADILPSAGAHLRRAQDFEGHRRGPPPRPAFTFSVYVDLLDGVLGVPLEIDIPMWELTQSAI